MIENYCFKSGICRSVALSSNEPSLISSLSIPFGLLLQRNRLLLAAEKKFLFSRNYNFIFVSVSTKLFQKDLQIRFLVNFLEVVSPDYYNQADRKSLLLNLDLSADYSDAI